VYLAYQLWDSVNYDQMVGESINRGVDLGVKKKQLVASLNEAKLAPQNDERVRKGVISSTFHEHLFCTKMLFKAFL